MNNLEVEHEEKKFDDEESKGLGDNDEENTWLTQSTQMAKIMEWQKDYKAKLLKTEAGQKEKLEKEKEEAIEKKQFVSNRAKQGILNPEYSYLGNIGEMWKKPHQSTNDNCLSTQANSQIS